MEPRIQIILVFSVALLTLLVLLTELRKTIHNTLKNGFPLKVKSSFAGADLFKGLLHEVGHSLGLDHSKQNNSIMRSHIRLNYDPHFQLHDEDIRVIQALYGKRTKKPPDLCSDASFDAIFEHIGGVVYVLKGSYYWQLAPDGLVSDYPRNIADQWPGLPSDIDAATATDTGVIYFFKGKKFWIYDTASQHTYNYSCISKWWPGIPHKLHGVTWISSYFYFFKDNKYWKYDPSQKYRNATYPRPLSDWGNIKGKLNDVLHSGSEYLYFFTDGSYYRSTYNTCLIGPNYPRPTDLYWFGCQANSECVNSPLKAKFYKGYGKSCAITTVFPVVHFIPMVLITVYEYNIN